MALEVSDLKISLRGKAGNIISSGLSVEQVVDSNAIAGLDFFVESSEGMDFDADTTTDKVFLVSTEGGVVELTRVGNHWRWTIGPTDLITGATSPGSSLTKTCQIVLERTSGGVSTRLTSRSFTLTIERKRGFNPQQIAGCIAEFEGWDITDAVAATVATWDDRTAMDRDLTEATNKPTRRNTTDGLPYLEFDGTNDLMATVDATFKAPCTCLVVARIRSWDATVRGIVQIGGTNGGRIAFDNTNLKGVSGSDVANYAHASGTTALLNNEWFVAVMTKAAAGAVTIQRNLETPATNASTAAVTTGTMTVGDTAADTVAAVDIAKIVVWDTVLSAANIEKAVRAYMATYGVVP